MQLPACMSRDMSMMKEVKGVAGLLFDNAKIVETFEEHKLKFYLGDL